MADWPLAQSDGQIYEPAVITSSTYGVTPIAGTAAKGSWVEVHPALPFDVAGFHIQAISNGDAASYVIDVGIGANTAEVVLLADWYFGAPRGGQAGQSSFFPVAIPKGKRVALRVRSSTNGSGIVTMMQFMSAGSVYGPSFSRITTYGISGADTADVDPGGSANTKGSWVTVAASVNRIRSMIINFNLINTAATTALWRVDIGIGATPQIVFPDLALAANTTNDELGQQSFGPFPMQIPAGVALKVRAQCNITDATDRVLRICAIYGMD